MTKVLFFALLANLCLTLVVANIGLASNVEGATTGDGYGGATDDCNCITDFDDDDETTPCPDATTNDSDTTTEDDVETTPDCDCGTTTDDTSCTTATDSDTDETTDVASIESPVNCTDALERTRQTLLTLSWKLAYISAIKNPKETFIGSALGVFLPFYQLLKYTKRNTAQYNDLTNTVSIQAEEVCCVTGKFSYDVSKVKLNVLAYGVDISANVSFPFTNDFKKNIKTDNIGVAENVNFARPGSATDDINESIEMQTGDKVQDTIPSSKSISKYTELATISAFYLKTSSAFPFLLTLKPGVFNIAPFKTAKTSFLNGPIVCNYTESLNSQFIELPFGDGLKVVIALPPAYTQLELLKSLSKDASVYDKISSSMKPTLVEFTLPFINITTDINEIYYLKEGNIASTIRNRSTVSYENAFAGNATPILNAGFQKNVFIFSSPQAPSNPPTFSIFQPRKPFNCNVPYIFMVFLNNIPILTSVVANVEPSSIDTMI